MRLPVLTGFCRLTAHRGLEAGRSGVLIRSCAGEVEQDLGGDEHDYAGGVFCKFDEGLQGALPCVLGADFPARCRLPFWTNLAAPPRSTWNEV